MRRILAACVLLLWAAPARAQTDVPLTVEPSKVIKVDRTVIVPTDVLTANVFPFKVKAPPGGLLYRWQYPESVKAASRHGILEVTWAPAGEITFTVEWVVIDFEKKKPEEKFGRVVVLVGDVPPGPGPGPKPPEPKPPDPKPGVITGLRVLIVEESADRGKLPASQFAVLFSKTVRDWLDAHCAADKNMASGKAWMIQDKDTDLSAFGPAWEGLRKRPRNMLPWVVIDSDQGVQFDGPMPADVPMMLKLLNTFAPTRRKAG